VRAPGTLAAHYAPRARVVLLTEGAPVPSADGAEGAPPRGWLAAGRLPTPPGMVRLAEPADARGYAQVLYAALREADALGLAEVLAVPPSAADDVPGGASAVAVADRLRRAAASR
jgi:L-threonylcarbamoyladenylate synthase